MDNYENYKDIELPLHITFYKTSGGCRGLKVSIATPQKTKYAKIFKFKNFIGALSTLEYAKEFMKKDEEFLKYVKIRDSKGRKSRVIDYEQSVEYYCKKNNIYKFPVILNNNKFIGIDYINSVFVFIKECNQCKKHVNVGVNCLHKSLNGLCRECLSQTNYFGRNYKYLQFYYLNEEKTRAVFKCNLTTKQILVFNKNINANNFNMDFKTVVKLYEEYFLYYIDNFIIKYNLNFKRNLDNKTFLKLETKYTKVPLIIKEPKYHINIDEIDKYRLKVEQHIFKAKIQGFGTNKKDESKMVVLEEVEYIGIDNFRDHMWTTFSKQLDLPVGTTIKFKGEIYDYEREYLGTKEVDKNGQSIKIIELLEVDRSTRERVKLYK